MEINLFPIFLQDLNIYVFLHLIISSLDFFVKNLFKCRHSKIVIHERGTAKVIEQRTKVNRSKDMIPETFQNIFFRL